MYRQGYARKGDELNRLLRGRYYDVVVKSIKRRIKAAIKPPRESGRKGPRRRMANESPGHRQKPRCSLAEKASIRRSLICVFLFPLSLSLSLFLFVRLVSITNRHGDPCRGTNRRIGELLRKEVGYTPRSDNEEPRL